MATAQRPRRDAGSIPIRLGPWRGVRDLGDAGAQDPAFAQDAINCWFQDPQNGGAVYARPGFQKLTSSSLESGQSPTGFFNCEVAGTPTTFVFVNGKVYRQSGATSWTDVSPAGITIDNNPRQIYAIIYNGEMIVNDGVNEPWRGTNLSSSPITGTEIEINTAGSAWAARGKPTVHGGKLFFIVKSIASTSYLNRIVWSEEASAATGYLQDGFTNSWDLIQSPVASERLLAIQGTNAGLYYFRNYSIGVIYGAVNADFTTASTHDGVSNDVGMAAVPASIFWNQHQPGALLAGNFLWFLDNAYRPCRIRVGSTIVEKIWQQLRRKLAETRQLDSDPDDIQFDGWQFAYSADMDKVAAFFLTTGGDNAFFTKDLLLFDASSGNYEGRWRLVQTTQSGTPITLSAVSGAQRSSHIATAAGAATFIVGTTTGDVYQQTAVQMSGGDAVSFGDNAGAMHMSLTTMLTPDEQDVEFLVTGCSMEAGPDSGTLSLDQYTPRGAATSLSITGITNTDSIQSSHDHGIFRAGLFQLGRWWRGVFHWNVASGATPYFFERALITVTPRRTFGVTK